ncbi:MAG: Smr/MutS family protein [Fusobacteriaceae bacterium]
MIEIDLHHMNFDTALKIFIERYNKLCKQGFKGEICIIHGYGAGVLDRNSVISGKIREYFSRNKDNLKYRLDMNPGVTYVTPIKPLAILKQKKRDRF